MTENNKFTAEKERNSERFYKAFENITSGAIVIDEAGRIEVFNAAASKIFGYSEDEVLNKNVKILMPEPYQSQHDQYIENYKNTGHAKIIGSGREVSGRRKSGEEFPMHLGVGETQIGDRRLFIGSVVDLTEMRALQDQLNSAQRLSAIGQFTGGVAHDFNNLLGVVMGNLDLAQSELDPDDPVQKYLSSALNAVEKGANLTQHLLAFAREQRLNPHSIDANDIIRDTAVLIEQSVGEAVKIELDLADQVLPVHVDTTLFANALLNICINARDAMDGAGRLRIRTSLENLKNRRFVRDGEVANGSFALIAIEDDGHGMTPEISLRCMEPFFTTKDIGEGSGLGLSMVYGFVKQSDGFIEVNSDVDRGTRVFIYLPAFNQSGQIARNRSDEEKSLVRQNKRVLLVEDNADLRETIVKMLENLGYDVIAAATGDEAAKILATGTEAVDILLSDVVMPGDIDGFDLSRLVADKFPHIRVLLTSGFPDKDTGRPTFQKNAATSAPVLRKPFTVKKLSMALEKVIRTDGSTKK